MADFDKAIPPGEEGKINVKIYGNKIQPGRFRKSYTVTTNDPENKKVILYVSGSITRVLELSKPMSLSGFTNEDLKMETIITNRLETPIHLTGFHWSDKGKDYEKLKEGLYVELNEIEEGRKYHLKTWKKGAFEPGHYVGELVLTTDFDKLEEKNISVRLTVTPDVKVHPRTLFLREMNIPEGTSRSFDQSFWITAYKGDSLKVLQVIPDREDITVKVEEETPGKVFKCKVRVRPPSNEVRYTGSLKIITNYPGYEELHVGITGMVRNTAQKMPEK